MTRAALAALSFLCATSTLAETPMTAEEFDAFATGQTLTYKTPNSVFGTEEYLPGRRVRWSDGTAGCHAGTWFPKNGDICFLYLGETEPACWSFVRRGGRVLADLSDDAEALLYEVVISEDSLPCSGLKKSE